MIKWWLKNNTSFPRDGTMGAGESKGRLGVRRGLEWKIRVSQDWLKLEDNDGARLRNKRRMERAGQSMLRGGKWLWSLGINGENRGVTWSSASQVHSVYTWTSVWIRTAQINSCGPCQTLQSPALWKSGGMTLLNGITCSTTARMWAHTTQPVKARHQKMRGPHAAMSEPSPFL